MSEEKQCDKCSYKEEYYGFKCTVCSHWIPEFYFDEWESEEEYHGLTCVCEDCIQDYPERLYLLEDYEDEQEN